MKGLVGTDKFLRAVMDKERGLLPPKAVMSYVCAVEIPEYHKLLFITDTAVIPFPDLDQKVAMAEYAITMAGIRKCPRWQGRDISHPVSWTDLLTCSLPVTRKASG